MYTHQIASDIWYQLAREYAILSKQYKQQPNQPSHPDHHNHISSVLSTTNSSNSSPTASSYYSEECYIYWNLSRLASPHEKDNKTMLHDNSTTTATVPMEEVEKEDRYTDHNRTELIGIELVADKNPIYMKEAGGSMARFFFL